MLSIVLFVVLYASAALAKAPPGSCGAVGNGQSCTLSGSPCCSEYGYCGSGSDYCNAKCQSKFSLNGKCTKGGSGGGGNGNGGSGSIPISTDDTCGAKANKQCPGSCCSQYNYCGVTKDHCGTGCQAGFGLCGLQYSKLTVKQCNKPGQFALTFDDGPGAYSMDILDTLKKNKVKATFFVIGKNVNVASKQWRNAIKNSGHEIASHSYSHPHFNKLSGKDAKQEFVKTSDAIFKAAGKRPKYFRFPYDEPSSFGMKYLSDNKMKYIGFNMDTKDFEQKSTDSLDKAYKTAFKSLDAKKDSVISLNHDTKQVTSQYLDKLIKLVNDNGFHFVTMSECTG